MKKNFYLAIGAALLISKTMLAQDTIQRTTTTTDQVVTTRSDVAERRDRDPDPDVRHGIFGVRYMPTFSSVKFENSGGNVVQGDFVMSNGFGALLGVNLNKFIGVQAEVIYSRLSQKYKDDNLNQKINIDYVNIPLLLSLNTNRMRAINLNLVVGPQLGINVGSSLTTTGTTNGNTGTHAVLAVKKNDFGVAYGAGIDIGLNPMHTIRLDLGFRGVLGLLDVSNRNTVVQNGSYYILKKDHIKTYSGYVGLTFLF